jgi:hypothetical protein
VTAMVVASVVLAIVALALSYAGRAVLRPQPFADRAVAALRQPAVSDEVADRLADAVVRSGSGDLATVRPLVRAATGSIVSSSAFQVLLRRAVIEAHIAVVQRHDHAMAVNVADAGVLVAGLLRRFAPAAARTVNAERAEHLLTLDPGAAVLTAVRIARTVQKLAWILALLALLLAVAAVWRSRARRRTIRRLGTGLALGGLGLVALYTVGGAVAAQLAPSGRGPVVAALWQAFLGGLRVQALWTTAAGAVVAALASEQLRPAQVAEIPWQGWRRLTGSDGGGVTRTGLAIAVALIAAGVAILLEPGAVLRVAVLAVGAFLLYRGVEGVLRWGVGSYASAVASGRIGLGWARRGLRLVPVVLGLAAVGAVAALVVTGGGDEAPAATATPSACNGFKALCGRPLNDVAFAATHNSMASVTIPTFLFGQQDGTIADQLDFGIHGLLIDTYYGDKVDGGVRTDLESLPKRAAAERELGAPAVNAALRIRQRLERRGKGRRGIYLCHGFCEIGAVSLSSALTDLRSFLVSHPGAVVVMINQDEGVAPDSISRAFERAGLLDLVYRGPLGPFPTLREMINSNQRLVVMAENDAGDIPWYHLAYRRALQETPYRFRSTAALTDRVAYSCRPNRGPASAPLFLLNNWVDTTPVPRASNAAVVNARGALLTRSRTCQRIRHRLPNLVAVDFFRRGDVLGVVNALNGVGR